MATIPLRFLDGETRFIGVLGDPVRQVRSPRPLTAAMQAAGLNAINVPLHVRPDDLAHVVGSMKRISNVVGHLLTVPHKIAGLALVDDISDTARAAGAINVMRRESDSRWFGDNFDGAGFVDGLVHDGFDPAGMSAFVAGAGGAGCAVSAALAAHGVANLRIFDVAVERLTALRDRLAQHFPAVKVDLLSEADPSGVDIAVNATPLGMRPDDQVAFDIGRLRTGAVVAELVMKPSVTRLLLEARAAGHPIALGENVLNFQIERYVRFFAIATL